MGAVKGGRGDGGGEVAVNKGPVLGETLFYTWLKNKTDIKTCMTAVYGVFVSVSIHAVTKLVLGDRYETTELGQFLTAISNTYTVWFCVHIYIKEIKWYWINFTLFRCNLIRFFIFKLTFKVLLWFIVDTTIQPLIRCC